MSQGPIHAVLPGRCVIVGFGSIGQGVLPLILRHLAITPDRIAVVTADEGGRAVAAEYGVAFHVQPLTADNYRAVLTPMLSAGDFIVNLSVDVSSRAMVELAHELGCLYVDTVAEPWAGAYFDDKLTASQRSNYALREDILSIKPKLVGGPTACIVHGANPGMVTHFIKEAALNIARDVGLNASKPQDRAGWAHLLRTLGVKVIHIAERDTQKSKTHKVPGEFVNTWSIDGFVSEGCQPAELGWGTHEGDLPPLGARHDFGSGAAIYINRPGAGTPVRTWTPKAGPFIGLLVTHHEAISTADYFSVVDGDQVLYRPTVHYAYHPCDDAIVSVREIAANGWAPPERKRLIVDDIEEGIDELGVLLAGHAKNAYWFGSQLSAKEARELIPHNSATSLQVTVGVLAAMVWALENPKAGLVEPEELDHERIMEIARPYLGPVVGAYTDWTPLQLRTSLFAEPKDESDPWRFINVLAG